MKDIFFCGDPHGQFAHIIDAVRENSPAAIVLLGDQECERSLDDELAEIASLTQIFYIPGNHDGDSERYYDNLFGSAFTNLHGRVIEVAGVRIAGLGGIFREKVWHPKHDQHAAAPLTPAKFASTLGKGNLWRGGLPLRHRTTIFASEIASLSKLRTDLLVTHEAPGANAMGVEAITNLSKTMRVRHAFHGHHHSDIVYRDGVWRGVGLRGITSISGRIIVPGELEQIADCVPYDHQ